MAFSLGPVTNSPTTVPATAFAQQADVDLDLGDIVGAANALLQSASDTGQKNSRKVNLVMTILSRTQVRISATWTDKE